MIPRLFLHDERSRSWLAFQDPLEVFAVHNLGEVQPALATIEAAVSKRGLWAAGFLSYEAAPAFEPAMQVQPAGELPLLWFGLFEPPHSRPLPLPETETAPDQSWRPDVSQSKYSQAVLAIKGYIAAGDTYQVNYTFRLRASFQGEPWQYFLQLQAAQRSLYSAYLDLGRWAICSASPELFFRLDGLEIVSRPMKGTARRGRTLAEDRANMAWLRTSEKNRSENVMIVDMLRNDIGRVAQTGSVAVPELFAVERYPTVLQMTSTVTGRTDASLQAILGALFPCASITGAPKIRTMQITGELERGPRGLYTGAIGYLAPGRQAQFNVAIRTAVIDRRSGQAEYGTGSGIVWDSQAQDEYAESELKARVLTVRRPPFELLESLLWTPQTGFFLLERHLKRLADSAEYFQYPFVRDEVTAPLVDLEPRLAGAACKIRLRLNADGRTQVEMEELPEPPALDFPPDAKKPALRVALAADPVDSGDVFLFHKTTCREVYDQALKARSGFEEVLLWNERGDLTECTRSNLVVRVGEAWHTPPLDCGLLAGVLRAELLETGKLIENVLTQDGLQHANGLWAINSVRGWQRLIVNEQ